MKFHLTLFLLSCSVLSIAQDDIAYYEAILDTTTNNQTKLTVLDSLFVRTKNKDAQRSARYTEAYVKLALSEGLYEKAISKMIKGSYDISHGIQQPERALSLLNTVETYLDKVDDSYLKGSIYLKQGGAYFMNKHFTKANEKYAQAVNNYTDKDSIYKADALYFRGQSFFEMGQHLKAIKDYEMAYAYYEALDDNQYTRYTEASIISIYGINGFDKKTIEARNVLIEKIEDKRSPDLVALYINQAINYENLEDYRMQESFLLNAHNLLSSQDTPNYIEMMIASSALSRFYAKHSQLVKAKQYLDEVAAISADFEKETLTYANYLMAKSIYNYEMGNYQLALSDATKVDAVAEEGNYNSQLLNVKEQLSKIYEALGDERKSLQYYKEYKHLNDSLYSITKTNALSYYQSLFETERRQKEVLQREAEIDLINKDIQIAKNKSRILWITLIGLVLLAAGLFLFTRQRSQQRRKILQLELEGNKRELMRYTKELLDKSNSMEILKTEIDQLKKEIGSDDKIEKLQELVSLKILTSDHWSDFKNKFNTVYPSLLLQAREVNKDITNSEERLIALERLNLKTPEIANILGVSPESVVKVRYRLRKKLGISKETPILDFIEAQS